MLSVSPPNGTLQESLVLAPLLNSLSRNEYQSRAEDSGHSWYRGLRNWAKYWRVNELADR